jgi:hypothetical protein
MLVPTVPSIHPTVSISFLFFRVPVALTACVLNLACGIFASLGPRNDYKDMLSNMVSPIDHVFMNHQNQTRTNGIWGHVRYGLHLLVIYDNTSKASINLHKLTKLELLTLAWMLTIIQTPSRSKFPLFDLLLFTHSLPLPLWKH